MNNLALVRLRSLQVRLRALRARPNTVESSCSPSGVNRSPSGANRSLSGVEANDHSGSNSALLHGRPVSQSGVVLVISLIMLLLLTVIGSSAMQTTSLEEKMAGNLRDKDLAFQAAESALRAAENSLNPPAVGIPAIFPDSGTGGFYSTASTIPTNTAILTSSFWTTNPVAPSTVTNAMLGNNIAPPVYIIQQLPAACLNLPCPPNLPSPMYKITVRATGASANTVVILQSIYTPP